MKQLIVLLATLPVILGLLMQIGLAQQNFVKIMRIEQIVEDHRWQASEAGGFTNDIAQDMAVKISGVSGVPESGISMALDPPGNDGPHYIHFRIEILAFRLVAANKLFGINDSENSGSYVIEGSVISHIPKEDLSSNLD